MAEIAVSLRKTLAPAIVHKWNDSKAYVVCPFPTYQKVHGYGSSRTPEEYPNGRISHCDRLQQECQLAWPFEADSVAEDSGLRFELERETGAWKTIGTDIEDPETEEVLKNSA